MLEGIGTTELILILAVWFIVGFATSMLTMMIYENKGKSKWTGFFLGLLLGLIGLLIALMVRDESGDAARAEQTTATKVMTSMVGSPAQTDRVTPNSAYYVALVGAVFVAIGSVLPWVSATTIFGTMTKSGIEGDGVYTLVFSVLTGVGVIVGFRKPRRRAWAAGVFSLLSLAVGIVDYGDVSTRLADVSNEYAFGSVGIGLYLVILGGFLGLASFARNPDLPESAPDERAATKTCPQCAEEIKEAARVCRFCGHQFTEAQPELDRQSVPIAESDAEITPSSVAPDTTSAAPAQAVTVSEEDLLKQGIAALKSGQKGKAQDLLMQVVEQDERNEMAWLWLSGAVQTAEERYTCLEKVLEINPHNGTAQRGLETLRRRSPGMQGVPVAVSKDSQVAPGMVVPSTTDVESPPATTSDINELLRQAVQAIKSGNTAEGKELLLEVIEQDENNEAAWLWMTRCVPDREIKRECFERVLEINPNNEHARKALERLDSR